MHQRAASLSIDLRDVAAGMFLVPPEDTHRLFIHGSPATRTYCPSLGQWFVRRAGDIDLIPAGEGSSFESQAPFRTMRLALPPDIPGGGPLLRKRHMLKDAVLSQLAHLMRDEVAAGAPAGSLFLDSLAAAIHARLLAAGGHMRPTPPADGRIRDLIGYIDDHIADPLTTERLARVAGLSGSQLRARFKAMTGVPLHRFILRRRVARARELLLTGELSIVQVALETGFSHQSHLASWMRRETGQTPRALRAQPIGR